MTVEQALARYEMLGPAGSRPDGDPVSFRPLQQEEQGLKLVTFVVVLMLPIPLLMPELEEAGRHHARKGRLDQLYRNLSSQISF